MCVTEILLLGEMRNKNTSVHNIHRPGARTVAICTISPASKDTEHTLSTLRHAMLMDGQLSQMTSSGKYINHL